MNSSTATHVVSGGRIETQDFSLCPVAGKTLSPMFDPAMLDLLNVNLTNLLGEDLYRVHLSGKMRTLGPLLGTELSSKCAPA